MTRSRPSNLIAYARAVGVVAVVALCGCGADSGPASSGQNQEQNQTGNQVAGSSVASTSDDTVPPNRFTIALKQNANSDRTLITVDGLNRRERYVLSGGGLANERWQRLLRVSVAADTSPGVPAMLGDYRLEDGLLVFEPRFPLLPGLKYRAVFDPGGFPGKLLLIGQPTSEFEFSLPELPAAAPTKVTAVYPSRNTLPENQLKFYLHFSAPMSWGEVYQRVHLLRSTGEEVDLPFLELGEELWDNSGTRITLLFDPGRIKRGLKPREEVGPALEEGKSYTLVIDGDWLDADGRPLSESFRKPFRVLAPDTIQPNPARWKFDIPAAGSTEPLVVHFAEPLDQAMLERVLNIKNAAGKFVTGTITIDEEETRWRLRPDVAWSAGTYSLIAETTLEDLAANSIAKPFEVDVLHPITQTITTKTVSLPFEIEVAND